MCSVGMFYEEHMMRTAFHKQQGTKEFAYKLDKLTDL